jgi:hypothetical protein
MSGKLFLAAGAALICLALFAASPARAAFGFKALDLTFTDVDGSPVTQAGSHPFAWTTTVALNSMGAPGEELPDQAIKDLRIELPPGLVGTPGLLPRCSHDDFLAEACAAGTEVGAIELETDLAETEGQVFPLYNLSPLPGSVAELGFVAVRVPVTITIKVNPDPPHNLVATIARASQAASFFGSVLTVHGVLGGHPFLTLPRSCKGPLTTVFEADSWQRPGVWTPPTAIETHDDSEPPKPLGTSGCGNIGFEPIASVEPTTAAAHGASGLDFRLDAPDEGIVSPTGVAQADVRDVVLALPEGMTVNASIAEGLGACGPADLARETPDSDPGAGCPSASKIGTAEVESPLLDEPLAGSVFVARPDDPATPQPGAENPSDSLLALYVVLKDSRLGIVLKQAVKLDPAPGNGRLTVRIGDIPQLPFSRLELHLRGGARSPLVTPPACGAYDVEYSLTPSSGAAALEDRKSFRLAQDCGAPRFKPALAAGATNPVAGVASSFILDLSRGDGEQNPSKFSLSLPKGLNANLAAVPVCPERLVAAGSCPAGSRVGTIRIAAGTGAAPVWIPAAGAAPSAAVLAGPYDGAPFSLAVIVPAQAGPFDLGTIVTRAPIFVDPETAQTTVRLDPLPQILEGIPIAYRTIRLLLDRPGFVNNPTSCAVSAVRGSVTSATGTVAPVASRFQVGGCARLAFKPKVSVGLLGPTHRSAHPKLRTVLTSRPGDANIAAAAVTLPATELLDSRHIGAVCTRAQFAGDRCPADSVYGQARAWTPLLDQPLQGPVYLRASDSKLPDLAVSLSGQIHLDLTARVDSVRGRLRTSFEALPDAPLSKVVLTMKGGKRGLFVNTKGLCARKHRAVASFKGQNGKRHDAGPVVRTDCGAK